MAYGTTITKGATVTTSRESSRAARALKRAIHAGLNSAGVDVDDLEMAPVPVTRFQVRTRQTQGGITVRLAPNDPQSVVIRFFGPEGVDLDEGAQRKIERTFYRQDFRRAFAAEIGDIGFAPRALEHYTAALIRGLDIEAIRSFGFQIVVDYGYGSTSVLMPNVLAKLGADVLAVNPYASTKGAAAFEANAHARRVAQLVRTSNAHLGAVIDPDGERLVLVDDTGRTLTHDQSLMALVSLVAAQEPGARIALPVAASRAAEQAAAEHGAEIVWTKLSAAHLMETARRDGIALAASQDGGFIFPDFLPAYDASAALVKVLELLARSSRPLSKLVAELPQVNIAHETVVTPWEEKGMIMRVLVERLKDRQLVLVDGVKVLHENGWALVLPDPEEPLSHVWAEGASDAEARGLAQEYARRLQQMLR
jgi:mannose-1-phosphate guanylyltransferase/phosphomannomutase